jgi:hypothetical protein
MLKIGLQIFSEEIGNWLVCITGAFSKVIENGMRVWFSLQPLCETFFVRRID